jgi:hypothetical protein
MPPRSWQSMSIGPSRVLIDTPGMRIPIAALERADAIAKASGMHWWPHCKNPETPFPAIKAKRRYWVFIVDPTT